MTTEEATAAVIDALEDLSVPYMLVGSLSSNVYGVPRATQDADFVIRLGESVSVSMIAQRLGPRFRLDPQSTFEIFTTTTRYVLQPVDISFVIELFLLSDDPHDQERFARRRRVKVLGRDTWILSVEDVIVTKLRWSSHGGRSKDVDDVRNVIALQHQNVDWDYVKRWCDMHGTRQLLEDVRRSVPQPKQT
jgi:hypothetical protein